MDIWEKVKQVTVFDSKVKTQRLYTYVFLSYSFLDIKHIQYNEYNGLFYSFSMSVPKP